MEIGNERKFIFSDESWGFHERLEEFILKGRIYLKVATCHLNGKIHWCGFGVFKRISEKSMSEISRRGMDSNLAILQSLL
jgi:hypothetical protein